MPDAAAGESIDHPNAELLGGAGGVFQFLGRSLIDSRRVAITPNVIRKDRLMPLVDVVQDRLANQMRADRVALQPGVIQLHDNGDVAPSRMVRYRIDEQARTATLIWEFIDSPGTHTPVGGSTDVLQADAALVSFGRAGRVVETDANGQRTWELTGIDGLYVFRAQRIPSLYASERSF